MDGVGGDAAAAPDVHRGQLAALQQFVHLGATDAQGCGCFDRGEQDLVHDVVLCAGSQSARHARPEVAPCPSPLVSAERTPAVTRTPQVSCAGKSDDDRQGSDNGPARVRVLPEAPDRRILRRPSGGRFSLGLLQTGLLTVTVGDRHPVVTGQSVLPASSSARVSDCSVPSAVRVSPLRWCNSGSSAG